MTRSRIVALLTPALLLMPLAACGSEKSSTAAKPSPSTPSTSAATATATPTEEAKGTCDLLSKEFVAGVMGIDTFQPDDRSKDGKLICAYIGDQDHDTLQFKIVRDADAIAALKTFKDVWKSQCKNTLPLDVPGTQGILCQQGMEMIVPQAYASWGNYEVEVVTGDLNDPLDDTITKKLRTTVAELHKNLTPDAFTG